MQEKDSGFAETINYEETVANNAQDHKSIEKPPMQIIPTPKQEAVIQKDAPAQQVSATEISKENSGASKPSWVKDLPPEAYDLLMQQNAQLRQLQDQISMLLKMQEKKEPVAMENNAVAMDNSVSSINTTVSRDSGTDCQSIGKFCQ